MKRKIYNVTKKELKQMSAKSLNEGDWVICGKYVVYIKYGKYKTPSLCSEVGLIDKPFSRLHCVPGVSGGRPYFIDNFLYT